MQAARGYVIVKPFEDSSSATLSYKEPTDKQKGTIVAVGPPLETDFNAEVTCPYVEGDRIFYAAMYEEVTINSVLYRVVKFQNIMFKYDETER